jgi:hypothetical protein
MRQRSAADIQTKWTRKRFSKQGSILEHSKTANLGITYDVVMLSEALQRDAKHEAKLSNISGPFPFGGARLHDNPRFFASLGMTILP